MAILNSWQRIDRVLPGRPFGDGSNGAYSSATIPTLVNKACTGTEGASTLNASTSSPFTVGDILLIQQTRGTGVGQWEINRVSAVGSGSYTMQTTLKYTYVNPAQAIVIPRYTSVSVGGAWSVANWDGTTGGNFVIACNGTVSGASNIVADYTGFVKGAGGPSQDTHGTQGEGTVGAGAYATQSANGNGGGAGIDTGDNWESGGGGGGGNGAAGSAGLSNGGSDQGSGGTADGSADLTDFVFGGGGGGGGGSSEENAAGGAGGDGGGGILIFAKNYALTGYIYNRGQSGTNGSGTKGAAGGGGGAGGSILVVCQTATLGSNLLIATAGNGGLGTSGITRCDGGAGGTGRVAVHHSGTVTGTTNPSFNDTNEPTLIETQGGFLANFI